MAPIVSDDCIDPWGGYLPFRWLVAAAARFKLVWVAHAGDDENSAAATAHRTLATTRDKVKQLQ